MSRRELVWLAAYGAAFAAALVRLNHGGKVYRYVEREGFPDETQPAEETVDASAEAHRIATEHADLAARSVS